ALDQWIVRGTNGQCAAHTDRLTKHQISEKENDMTPSNLGFKLVLAGFASAVSFVLPAVSAPISVFAKDPCNIVSVGESQIVLGRNERGGASRGGAARAGAVRGGAVEGGAVRAGAVRGGAVEGGAVRAGAVRGGAVEGGAAYRGGAVVRRGAVVT